MLLADLIRNSSLLAEHVCRSSHNARSVLAAKEGHGQ
jgi:hypothetical protein